jgi:two-component system chemotaxis sensor kinase CheA
MSEGERARLTAQVARLRQDTERLTTQDTPPALLARLQACVEQLTNALGGSRDPTPELPSLPGEAPASAVLAGVGRPEWVDDVMMNDFFRALPEALDELEGHAVALENGEEVDFGALKRRLHTLKGEAGLLGIEDMSQLAHAAEEVLVGATLPARQGTLLLEALEWMRSVVSAYREGRVPPAPPQLGGGGAGVEDDVVCAPTADAMAQRTGQVCEGPSASATESTPSEVQAGTLARDEETLAVVAEFLDEAEEGVTHADQVLVNVEREGLSEEDTHSLFRTFHSIKGVAASLGLEAIAKLAHQTESVLNLVRKGTLRLAGGPLEAVFDATECMRTMLSDLRVAVQSNADLHVPSSFAAIACRLASIHHQLSIPPQSLAAASSAPAGVTASNQAPTASIAERPPAAEPVASAAVEAVASPPHSQPLARSSGEAPRLPSANKPEVSLKEVIKVDVERIDSLVEMIGELVIAESMVVNLPEIAGLSSHRAQKCLGQLTKITRDLQRVGMSMRMVQVKTVFQKMARVVRDIAKKSNKQVTLQIEGDSAEMDRGMVDAIADPIVHMIRNSVDHGLESSEERLAAGKPSHGTIRLSASHEGGSIVIEVGDDGRGLDTDRILEKARSLGLVGAHQTISEADAHELIFHPGFSTARQVTEISGRGVGMDVVKRAIEALNGRIHIESIRGVGTTFRFILPITLAIIDGMLIAIGDEHYILPTGAVVESIQPRISDVKTYANNSEMLLLRGELFPLLRLARFFGAQSAKDDVTECLIVVVEAAGVKIGLLVDSVVTQQQVVIKNLGSGIGANQYISGAAILSDGRVGLILNVDALGHLFGEGRTHGGGIASKSSALSTFQ